jgi:phage shock protein C
MKRLYKSDKDRKIGGVCAGIAEYFDVDPTLVRAGYLLLTILTAILPGIIAYIALLWLMPTKGAVRNG